MTASEPGWDLYRTFASVMREGSLSGAARALALTQPTVARHVDALEAHLGRRLFMRSQRGLSPTEAARRILPHAEALAATSAALLRAAAAGEEAVSGTVRIGASEVVGAERLPPILAALRRRHPALTFELALSNDVEDLLRGDADVAVRMVAPAQQALVARRIGSVELGFFARGDYLSRCGVPDRIEALREFDIIGFDRETPALRAMIAAYPWMRREDFALRAGSDLAQLAAIRGGFGIGVCQCGVAERDSRLARVLPEAFAPELPVWVVMHEDLRSSPPCRAVFDGLADALAAEFGRGASAQIAGRPPLVMRSIDNGGQALSLFRAYRPRVAGTGGQREGAMRAILRTIMGAAVAVALAGAAQAEDALARVKAAGVMKVGTETAFAPFDFIDAGEHTGLNVDLFDEIGKELGVKIEWVTLPWDGVLPGPRGRQVRHGRRPRHHHQGAHGALPLLAADRRGHRRAAEAAPATTADHQAGGHRRQGGRRRQGDGAARAAAGVRRDPAGQVEAQEYVGFNEAYADLAAGRIVAVGNSLPNIAYVAQQRPDTFAVVMPPFGVKTYFGFIGRKDADYASLMDAIDAALLKMKKDGRLAELQKKWFGVDLRHAGPMRVNSSPQV